LGGKGKKKKTGEEAKAMLFCVIFLYQIGSLDIVTRSYTLYSFATLSFHLPFFGTSHPAVDNP
jgi:hypothetical protein